MRLSSDCLRIAALLCTLTLVCLGLQLPTPALRSDPGAEAYSVDAGSLPESLRSTLIASAPDAETSAFLAASRSEAASLRGRWALLLKHKAYAVLLRLGWTRVDASAALGRVRMFVASSAQLRPLLERAAPQPPSSLLLDIGSGAGTVTHALASALGLSDGSRVTALESSAPLRRELGRRWGFRAAASLSELDPRERFQAVSLLNVLDRVDDPAGLLRSAASRLDPAGGLLVCAVVLPFRGSVQLPGDRRRPPRRPLQLRRASGHTRGFGRAAAAFVDAALEALRQGGGGAEGGRRDASLLAWTRLPYLSSSDVGRTHYSLDDAVFVLRVGGEAKRNAVRSER